MELWALDDEALAKEVKKKVGASETATVRWRTEAEEDFNFAAGNQWSTEDIQKLEDEKRPIITFNRCNVILSAIVGMEANQRQEVRYNPRENSDVNLAEAYTRTGEWAREYGDIPSEEAQIFENVLTCGMGWSESHVEYERDLDGMILQETRNPLEMYWDTRATKRNLTDAEWVCHKQNMTISDIMSKFDKDAGDGGEATTEPSATLIKENVEDPYGEESRDVSEEEAKGVPIYHFQWYENVPIWRVKHPQTGKIVEITEEDYEKSKEFITANAIPAIKQKKRKYYRVFCSSKTVYKKEELASQTGFTLKCITGKRDHVNKSWFGIIRLIKDPQRWANKFFSTFLDIIDSNAKGGIMIEAGAGDVPDIEAKWSKADSVIVLNQGAIANQKIMPKPVAQYPQSIDRLLTFSIQSIHDASGVNLELLGAVDRAEIGVVVDSRKRSAYTILAPFFDSLKVFRQSNAITLMEFIKNYVPVERIAEILPAELKQMAQAVKDIDLQRIHVIISESPQSDNNRYNAWMFISQLLPQLLQMGVPMPPSVIDYSPLPAGLIAEWKALLQKKQQPDPEQQKQKQLMEALAMAKLDKEKAEAQATQSKAAKTAAETQQTQVETQQLQQEMAAGMNLFGAY